MKSVGIIGFGSFGKFLAEKLHPHTQVYVFSYSGKGDQWKSSLETVATCDYLLLSIPLDAYRSTLEDLKPLLRKDTVIVDICSVKVRPVQIIQEVLPSQPIIATHPLFGPESAADSLEGHTLVMCPELSDLSIYDKVRDFSAGLGMEVLEMSADEHDQEMAVVQGLTFYIAHALKDMGLHKQRLSTPSFKRLLHLADLEQHHSYDLFKTIQMGNVHTAEVRNKFLDACTRIDQDIAE